MKKYVDDPATRERVLNKLWAAWNKNHHLRLGQLLIVLTKQDEIDLFAVSDSHLETLFDQELIASSDDHLGLEEKLAEVSRDLREALRKLEKHDRIIAELQRVVVPF